MVPSVYWLFVSTICPRFCAGHQFPDDVWNTPESGNGIPDLLDEVFHTADYLVRLQDRRDGGMYAKVHDCNWYYDMPQKESIARFMFAKTTPDTASTCAALASASRVARQFDSVRADVYLVAALRAWHFLSVHTTTVPVDGFVNPPGCGTGVMADEMVFDNILWAAAELYRTTGNATFAMVFEDWVSAGSPAYLGTWV